MPGSACRRLGAAAVLVAAAGLGVLPVGPATAAACSSDSGVTVVVDFHQLGGGVHQVCDPDGGGKNAQTLFSDNGFTLTPVQSSPGFVCRVNGLPADDPCTTIPPADAYWGLFWATGTSGSWTYATQGVGALTVPDGGYVGFSWQGSTSTTPPGVSPAPHTSPSPSPSPTPKPSRSPGHGGGGSATPSPQQTPTPTPTVTVSPSVSPTQATRTKRPRPTPTPTPTPTDPSVSPASASASSADPSADEPAGGLPLWAVAGVLVALAGAGAMAAYLRRRGPRPGGGSPG